MAAGYKVHFWQNMPSPHQAAHLRAIAELPGMRISASFAGEIPRWRSECGWVVPEFGRVEIRSWAEAVSRLPEKGWVHVFSGVRRGTPIRIVFERAVSEGHALGVMSETAEWRGLAGLARRAVGTTDRIRFGERIAFVLAIGSTGVRWFTRLGYSADRIFPYAYFVDPPPVVARVPAGARRIVFVGRLVHLKGVDLLLEALANANLPPWQLSVVGDGDEMGPLRKLAALRGLGDRVSWRGAVSPEEAATEIGSGDVLVLPSREKEGWGVVVNEALLQGVPVVCSEYCGAADLVRRERGEVVAAGSVAALARALESVLADRSSTYAGQIRRWAEAAIGPHAGALYFRAILDHTLGGSARPIAPWLQP